MPEPWEHSIRLIIYIDVMSQTPQCHLAITRSQSKIVPLNQEMLYTQLMALVVLPMVTLFATQIVQCTKDRAVRYVTLKHVKIKI